MKSPLIAEDAKTVITRPSTSRKIRDENASDANSSKKESYLFGSKIMRRALNVLKPKNSTLIAKFASRRKSCKRNQDENIMDSHFENDNVQIC